MVPCLCGCHRVGPHLRETRPFGLLDKHEQVTLLGLDRAGTVIRARVVERRHLGEQVPPLVIRGIFRPKVADVGLRVLAKSALLGGEGKGVLKTERMVQHCIEEQHVLVCGLPVELVEDVALLVELLCDGLLYLPARLGVHGARIAVPERVREPRCLEGACVERLGKRASLCRSVCGRLEGLSRVGGVTHLVPADLQGCAPGIVP